MVYQVIEWHVFYDRQSSMGINSKSINARVMVLALACHLMLIDIYTKFLENILNRFQVTEQT